MPPVLDSSGLTIQPATEIISEMEADFRDKFGDGMLLDEDTPEGKIIGVIAERAALVQQLAQAIYDAFDPVSACGVSLERIAAITSLTRVAATSSLVTLYLAGSPSTVIPLGTLAAVQDSLKQFQTLLEVTLGANGDIPLATGTAGISITTITRSGTVASVTTAAPHGLLAGMVVTVSGANEVEYNATAEIENVGASTFDYNMVSDPGGSATGTLVYQDEGLASDHLTFNTIVARSVAHGLTTGEFVFISGADQSEYNVLASVTVLDVDHFEVSATPAPTVTPATGSFNADEATPVQAESVETGPIAGPAPLITTIVNAISGWDRVENINDAVLGKDIETDAEFRERRLLALLGLGNATVAAVRGDMLLVTNVSTALVFENDTDLTVGNRPPHSIEAVVVGGADQDIGEALFASKAGGIATFGTESPVVVVDSQGTSHNVLFSRPDERDIWLELDFTVDSDTFPSDGLTQAEDAILAYGATLTIGDDVIVYPSLVAALDVVPGILDVVIRIADTVDGGGDPSPTLDDNVTISETQVSAWDRSRLTFITL